MEYKSRRRLPESATVGLIALLTLAGTWCAAASFNQLDDFEDATTMNWGGNKNGTVSHIPSGGPDGTNDSFLETSIANYHLGTKNTTQWTGDYLAAGIEAIEMDLNHLAPINQRLNMRIVLFGPGGTFASAGVTADLPTNTWTHVVFGLESNELVHVSGVTNLAATLANVTTLLIRHDSLIPTLPGNHPPHVTATLGIDNIHAVSRKPVMDQLTVNGNQVDLEVSRLVVGETTGIEVTDDLISGTWSNVLSFSASSELTNLNVTLDGNPTFLRTSTP